MALWVDEGASAIGTGVDEIRFGSEAVRLQMARDLSEVDTFSFGMENLHVDVVGDAAFAFADVEINARFGSESMRFQFGPHSDSPEPRLVGASFKLTLQFPIPNSLKVSLSRWS